MAIREEYEQLKAYAGIDGAIVGGLWILSFAFFIGSFYNPLSGIVSFFVGAASIVIGALRLRKFRDGVLGGVITFSRALLYSMLVYLYASLLMAAAQFVYFQFIDHGFMFSQYEAMISTPEYKAALELYGMKPSDVQAMMDNVSALSPIEIAMQFFTSNIILGFIVSLPISAMLKAGRPRRF